jgi:putative methionine-R-sulfoxide reductase with GAF domain/transcriptional regulator with XRE-family HTH domain
MDHLEPNHQTPSFSDGLRRLLREKRMTQTRLAEITGCKPQYVWQLLAEKRKPSPEWIEKAVHALGVPLQALDPSSTQPASERVIEWLTSRCTDPAVKASSFTLYLRDPQWPDDFRLAAWWGIKHMEPMHGLLLWPPREGPPTDQFLDYDISPVRRANQEPDRIEGVESDIPEDIPKRLFHLYLSFREREDVQSVAQLVHHDLQGRPEAILFVNFKRTIGFANRATANNDVEELKNQLKKTLSDLLPSLASIQNELREKDNQWAVEAARIVSPVLAPLEMANEVFTSPDQYFKKVLAAALAAIGVEPSDGLGTLHLFDADQQILHLAAYKGEIDHFERAHEHSVARGEGVVSWVALKRRPLVLADLEEPHGDSGEPTFRDLHMRIKDDARSEIAVPIISGSECIGVLCLESSKPKQFKPHHVRTLWYAANRLAVMYELHDLRTMNRQLLEFCATAVRSKADALTVLNELASFAARYLYASYCEIFTAYDATKEDFLVGAANDTDFFEPSIRRDGLTQQMRQWKCPVWVNAIDEERQYKLWRLESYDWKEGEPSGFRPRVLNSAAFVRRPFKCELGIPIIVDNECVAVTWVKYRRERSAPRQALLNRVNEFTTHVRLVLLCIRRTHPDLGRQEKQLAASG